MTVMEQEPAPGKSLEITPAKMIVLGAGWFGSNFFWAFYSGPMPLFLKNFTDSKLKLSLVLSMAGIASCLVPPIVGYFSDRSHTRFGRRKPYVFIGMSGVLLCLLGLPYAAAFTLVILISAIMYLSISFAETPLFSLLPDITPPQQRSTASGVVHLLGSMGLITFFIISWRIWDEYPTTVFRMVGIVTFGSALTTIALIAEPDIPVDARSRSNPLNYLAGVVKERNVLKFFGAQFSWWLGFHMVAPFVTLFLVEELGVGEGKSQLVPMALTIVSTVFVLPLGILGDRAGRKQILSYMIALWAVAGLFMGLSQNFAHALIAVGVTGIPFAAVLGIGYAYMLDLVPPERTAEFVGFSVLSLSAPMIFGPVIGGRLIDTLGYRSIFPASAVVMIIGLVILQFTRPRQ